MTAQAVVFDMDGTLTDTEPLYRDAFFATGAALGVAVRAAFHDSLVGLSSRDRAPMLLAEYGSDFPAERFFAEYRVRKAACLRPGVPLRAGALATLQALRQRGVACAVATSATRRTALDMLGRGGLLAWLDAVVTRDDVAAGKPDPRTHRLAAERIGQPPAACLAVEDSAPGIAAAQAAGMRALCVGDADVPPGAARLGHLADLLAHLPARAMAGA